MGNSELKQRLQGHLKHQAVYSSDDGAQAGAKIGPELAKVLDNGRGATDKADSTYGG